MAIYQLRKKSKLSQEELAELSDVGFKHIGKIERRETKDIKLSTLSQISKGLRIKTSDLIAYAEELQMKNKNRINK